MPLTQPASCGQLAHKVLMALKLLIFAIIADVQTPSISGLNPVLPTPPATLVKVHGHGGLLQEQARQIFQVANTEIWHLTQQMLSGSAFFQC